MMYFLSRKGNDMTAKHWTTALSYAPCKAALDWLKTQPDAQTAWDTCRRGDWMLYHAGKLAGAPGSDARRNLVLAACACARLALPRVRKGELRPLRAIEITEQWALGGHDAPTLNQVRAAAAAAYAAAAAADAAADAAYAAAAAAADAADAAAAAADAAADAAAAAAAAAADAAKRRDHYLTLSASLALRALQEQGFGTDQTVEVTPKA